MCNISNTAHHVCTNSSSVADKLSNACSDCRRDSRGEQMKEKIETIALLTAVAILAGALAILVIKVNLIVGGF